MPRRKGAVARTVSVVRSDLCLSSRRSRRACSEYNLESYAEHLGLLAPPSASSLCGMSGRTTHSKWSNISKLSIPDKTDNDDRQSVDKDVAPARYADSRSLIRGL